jgi:hypothetical protein
MNPREVAEVRLEPAEKMLQRGSRSMLGKGMYFYTSLTTHLFMAKG